jgi:amino acid transporter
MTRRANVGTLLAAVGAVLLLISLFVDWWKPDLSAWTVFEVVDLILAAIAALVLLVGAGELTRNRLGVDDRILAPLGIAALLLVIVSIVNNPPAAQGLDEKAGAWIALAGAILLGVGAFLGQRRISVVISSERPQHRPGWADPHPPTQPRGPTGPGTEPPGSEEVTRPNNPSGAS